ncbi:hypothetical protein [Xylanibacter brevis]|jgi:hypothetical protein|uniref:hypothetical protein n=1 Tax=Xylanibacter brevis TaxID=83231 RepID=UPI000481A9BE|nr:hypothetical protein [Xylanibacter brevis]
MDQLNLKQLEQIPIPEGLSERLSAKIDEWEQQELQQQHARQHAKQRKLYPSMWRITAVAACMALVFGVGYHLLSQDEYQNLAEQDTYQDPVKAQQEAQRALTLLAVNLNRGMGHLEKAKALSDKTERTLNEQLNNLK